MAYSLKLSLIDLEGGDSGNKNEETINWEEVLYLYQDNDEILFTCFECTL